MKEYLITSIETITRTYTKSISANSLAEAELMAEQLKQEGLLYDEDGIDDSQGLTILSIEEN